MLVNANCRAVVVVGSSRLAMTEEDEINVPIARRAFRDKRSRRWSLWKAEEGLLRSRLGVLLVAAWLLLIVVVVVDLVYRRIHRSGTDAVVECGKDHIYATALRAMCVTC